MRGSISFHLRLKRRSTELAIFSLAAQTLFLTRACMHAKARSRPNVKAGKKWSGQRD